MSLISEQLQSNDPPEAYREWQRHASGLLVPLNELLRPDQASIPIKGKASDHGLNADRLESVTRPLLLFVQWRYSLNSYREPTDAKLAESMERWFREALLSGTNPDSEEFWGWSSDFHQHCIEMGVLVIALELSRDWLWVSFRKEEREQILHWISFDIEHGQHWNKSMFFGILVMEFLLREGAGKPSFRSKIDECFFVLEAMYLSEGWFTEGMSLTVDFYNAYAWHYYSLWWIRLYGDSNADRCNRWKEYNCSFLENYPRFFSVNGEHPAFGRSITYRFNASAPFGMAQLLGISPVRPGLAREICERNMDFFLNKPIFQEQGCLSLGWYDHFETMVEPYSCGASPYWAVKAFAPLLLPMDDPFWSDSSEALPSELSDESVAFREAGIIVRSTKGEVEVINAGSQVGSSNARLGTWKWGRLSYRTGIGFLITHNSDHYPLDGGLTACDEIHGSIFGRHVTSPVQMTEYKMSCKYNLGIENAPSLVSVETHLWWKSGWQLIIHKYVSQQSAILRHGSYALSSDIPDAFEDRLKGQFYSSVWVSGKGIALQALSRKEMFGCHDRPNNLNGPREHIQSPYHAMRYLERKIDAESGFIACLSWAGASKEEAVPWEVEHMVEGCWMLNHASLGIWNIEDPFLPQLD